MRSHPLTEASAQIGGNPGMQLGLWLLAWNAVVPIRIGGAVSAGVPPGIWSMVEMLVIDQTSWALATYLVFRLALRARREPMGRVLAVLSALAIPLMIVRYLASASLAHALGWPQRPVIRVLWFAGHLHLFTLMAPAALGLLVVYMQRERDRAVLQATLRAELAAARLQTLQLQLNPHFLFNALNSIASLVHSNASRADTALGALSSFLRASLSSNAGDETSLESELRLVDAYLEIELLRFEWLTVDLDVPEALRSACVPAFVLQLLVENAIRHGLAPRRAPGRVVIAATLAHDRLTLSVSDDGVGLRASSGSASLGIGLENVRARLAQLYGPEGRLTLEPSRPHGTVATIHIPYRICPAEPLQAAAVA
jgi:signal transduction histidine kinase